MFKYLLPAVFIILTGFFLVLLLPLIFVAWLSDWWQTVTGTPHVCDAGTPPPDETTRLEEVTRRDAEEMQRAIDDAERILQDARELSDKKALLEDNYLPPVFERWWRRESDKRDPESPPWSEASEYD